MKLVPVDKKALPGSYSKTTAMSIIEKFKESNMDCAEVRDYTHKTANSCANSLKQSIKRFRVFNVDVIVRQNRVFLVKGEI